MTRKKQIQDNHRVQMFDSKGQFVGKFGTMGPGTGQFHHPQFIAVHKRTQNIYVTDSSNHRVCIFDHSGNPIFQFGSEGYQNGQLKFPRGIAVDDQVLCPEPLALSPCSSEASFLPQYHYFIFIKKKTSRDVHLEVCEMLSLLFVKEFSHHHVLLNLASWYQPFNSSIAYLGGLRSFKQYY